MYTLSIVSEVCILAFRRDDPVEDALVVEDGETLAAFDGVALTDALADYLGSGPPENQLWELGVRGGVLMLRIVSEKLRSVIDYQSPRLLGLHEVALLYKSTLGQLSDGAGENGFVIRDGAVLTYSHLEREEWMEAHGHKPQPTREERQRVLYEVVIGLLGNVAVQQFDGIELVQHYDLGVLESVQ
jgi:hypothetical protein